MLTFLSLFSGVGGLDLGLERAGMACAGQVEIDGFCQRVLAARWPGVERAGDVRSVRCLQPGDGPHDADSRRGTEGDQPVIDLLVGGFPCQGASIAGKRRGLADDRTALFWEIIRVQKIIQAPWALLENVPGLRSVGLGHDFPTVLAALAECWPAVGWRTLDSRFFNVAQRRERVFFVCGPTEAGVAQVLALTEGGAGDLEAGGAAGADVAHAVSAGAGGSKFGSGGDGQDDFVVSRDTAHALKAKGNLDHREDGDTLVVGQCHGSNVGPMGALRQGDGGVTSGVPFVAGPLLQLTPGGGKPGEGYPAVREGSAVRRLTPLECERLQGFPDGWTCLCQLLEAYAADPDAAHLRCVCPDSPRYRALGNAVTVSVVTWLGWRLMAALAGTR